MTRLDGGRGDAVAVVPAAGAGLRLGSGVPKALRLLDGEPLLTHAARRLSEAGSVGALVVAAPAGFEPAVAEAVAAGARPGLAVAVVAGGSERWQSVALALAATPPGFDIVLVHDAARPLTPPSLVERVAAAVRAGHDAVIPVLPVTDTIVQVAADADPVGAARCGSAVGSLVTATPDRATLRAVQTPQGFRRSLLVAAHAAQAGAGQAPVTDDAGLVIRLGRAVYAVPGAELAMKITLPADFQVAEALLAGTTTVGGSTS